MASIRRKGRNWQAVFGVYVDGRRIQRTRNFASQAAAKRYAAQMELQEQRGVGSARTTLGDYLASWLEAKAGTVERNTYAGYARWIQHVTATATAGLPLDRIMARDLEALYQTLSTKPAGRGRPLSARSIGHCHALLQNSLGNAVRDQLIDQNPATHAHPPKVDAPEAGAPSQDQVAALLADLEAHNADLVDFAILCLCLGVRRSEALGLRWQDVDWQNARIAITQAVIEFGGQWSIRPGTKSRAGRRTVYLTADVIDALRRQQAQVAAARLKLGRFWVDRDLIFPNPATGDARAPASITKAFARATRRAGWPRGQILPVHGLRHGAGSHALANGTGDVAAVSRALGHSSPAVTLKLYVHSDTKRDQAVAERMGGLVPKRVVTK